MQWHNFPIHYLKERSLAFKSQENEINLTFVPQPDLPPFPP